MTTTGEYAPHACRRAIWATLGFMVWTAAVLVVRPHNWPIVWPLVLFHCLLLLNTFFSIRTFGTIVPATAVQSSFDIVLGACILLAPIAFDRPLRFTLLVLLLFILATYKYILAIPVSGLSRILYRKIVVDMLGVVLTFAVAVGIWQGFVRTSSVLGLIAFAIANVYVLWLNPLYKLTPAKAARTQSDSHWLRFTKV